MPFAYHADTEANRALVIATAVALVAVALFTLWLIAIAPRNPDRRRRATWATLGLISAGLLAGFALFAIPSSSAELEPPRWWRALSWVAAGAFLTAPFAAFTAFFREEGRPAAAAIGVSLLVPSLLVAWFVGCALSNSCFH